MVYIELSYPTTQLKLETHYYLSKVSVPVMRTQFIQKELNLISIHLQFKLMTYTKFRRSPKK